MYKHMQCLLTFAFAHVTPSAAPAVFLLKPEQSGSDKNDGQKVQHIPKRICWLFDLLYRLRRGWLRCRRCGRRSGSWCIIGCRALYSSVLVTAGRATARRLDFLCPLLSGESLRRHRYSAPSARTRTGSAPLHRLQRGQIEAYTVRCQPPCKRRSADWIRIHPARILYRCTGSAGRRYSVGKSQRVLSGTH